MGHPAGRSKDTPSEVVRRTLAEHDTLVTAQRKVEAALTSVATKRQRAWAETVANNLRNLQQALQDHVDSAESANGLLDQMENRMLTIDGQVVYVLKDHKRLIDECQALIAKVSSYAGAGKVPLGEVRKNAAALMTNIRKHRSREANLMRDLFQNEGNGSGR
jgi:hemerythrin-like domain-containing protein